MDGEQDLKKIIKRIVFKTIQAFIYLAVIFTGYDFLRHF